MKSLPADPDGAYRICAGCGASAPGLWPEGWAIEQLYGSSAWIGVSRRMVVGERPYCPACQAAGQAVVAR